MASKFGICTNFHGCSKADNHTIIEVPEGQAFTCPECGTTLNPAPKGPKTPTATPSERKGPGAAAWLVPLLAVAVIAVVAWWLLTNRHHHPAPGPILVLAGSNTIGETLGPELVKGYLASINAQHITEQPKMADGKELKDEKLIEADLDGNHIVVEIRAHGSKTGFHDLLTDSADLGMSSEPVNDSIYNVFRVKKPNEDLRAFSSENIIGNDGIAVIVNGSSGLTELTADELSRIFSGNGGITDWAQVPGSGRTGHIDVYRRDNNSGTTGMFKTLVLRGGNFKETAQSVEKSEDLVEKVRNDPNAIGFVSYTFAVNQNGVRALALTASAAPGYQSFIPLPETIKSGYYLLSRKLYLYTLNSDTNRHVKAFLQFVADKEKGQDIVQRSGFVNRIIDVETNHHVVNGPPGYIELTKNAKQTSVVFTFQFGSSNLDNGSDGNLRYLRDLYYAPEYKDHCRFILVGFADSIGSASSKMDISKNRAKMVQARLEQMLLPVQAIDGFGDALPVHDNSNERERSLNRRVEVWITD